MSTKIQILSTALLDALLVEKAEAAGVALDALSFIEVSTIKDADIKEEVEELCHIPATAVFTSANAVRAISEIVFSAEPAWRIYCLGGATEQAVEQYFDVAVVNGVAGDAATLAGMIIEDEVYEVIFFCGDKRMDTLPGLLQAEDIMVHEVEVYKTEETPKIVTQHYDGILFFSPSGVNSFFSVNTIGSDTVLFAIGNTTAAEVMRQSDNKVITGTSPSKEHLLDQAIQYFDKQAAGTNGAK